MSLKINWVNNSISLFFLTGRSLISSSNLARVATSANLISLVEKLESKDDRSSSIFLPVSSSLLYFLSSHLLSSMLSQLIRKAGNLVDNIRPKRSSCRADITINDDNDDVVDAFVDDALVVISVDAAEPTDIVGDNGTPFLWTLNDNDIKKHGPITHSMRASRQHCLSKK